jgi:drug/metabolite transporter (DMT)-like permease
LPILALLLVLLAAFCHATWNLFLKKSQGGGTLFFWLSGSVEVLLYVPLAVCMMLVTGYRPDALALGLMAGSGAIHVGYFIFLDRGYRSGDLSVVYPLARATGPLLTIIAAVLFLGEHPAALAVAGAVLIGVGAVLLSGNPLQLLRTRKQGALFALSTGAIIAVYTVWDRQAVVAFLVPPVIYYWGSSFMRVIMTSPVALRDRPMLRVIWARDKKAVLAVGVLSPLSYALALYAMKMAPLSYVAPAREMSILIAALYGTHLLKEGDTARRLSAAALMVLGLAGIGLAG